MTSFIITSTNIDKRKQYIVEYCEKHKISTFDQTLIERETAIKQNIQSIGIEEIKNLQKKIILKPLQSEMKAVIIEEAHLLTIEAQNALLKVLEEPPDNTIMILSTDSREALLPTILSRCQIIELESEKKTFSDKEKKEFQGFIDELQTLSVGDRLKKAEQLSKDKEKAIEWIEKMIILLREKLLENVILGTQSKAWRTPESLKTKNEGNSGQARMTNSEYLENLKSFQHLHTLLKTTNVNLRFAIENTLLSI